MSEDGIKLVEFCDKMMGCDCGENELVASSRTSCVPKLGGRVKDKDGDIGIVVANDDHHNIEVEFSGGGDGFYCIVEGCKDYEKLFIL